MFKNQPRRSILLPADVHEAGDYEPDPQEEDGADDKEARVGADPGTETCSHWQIFDGAALG